MSGVPGLRGPRLADTEVERYSRQLLLPEVGEAGQLRLRQARVTVVGCGGLGVPAALYLGAAGVGRLRLVDPDRVELDNLQRQLAYRTSDLGRSKVEVLAERLSELNPEVTPEPCPEALGGPGLAPLLEGSELVLECSDDPQLKFAVNDHCVPRGVPLVVGGAAALSGQLVVVPAGGACYRCLFLRPPAGGRNACREQGVLGPLVGAIGALQALEAIKLICGIGTETQGRLLDFEAGDSRWREVRFPLDPQCPAHAILG